MELSYMHTLFTCNHKVYITYILMYVCICPCMNDIINSCKTFGFANAIVFHIQFLVLQFRSVALHMDSRFIIHSYT